MTPTDWETYLTAVTEHITGFAKAFFQNSAMPSVAEFTPEQWVKLITEDAEPPDLTTFDEKTLSGIQDYLEDLPEFTPRQSLLNYWVVSEWNRRERLETDAENIPDHAEDEGYLDKYIRRGSDRF